MSEERLLMQRVQQLRLRIAAALEGRLVVHEDFGEGAARLVEAMRYATLQKKSGRIRSILLMFLLNPEHAAVGYQLCAAIECLHSYTLVHDDLPILDNDDYRRGQLSCHRCFDEATALLAGNALFAKAFQIVFAEEKLSLEQRVQIGDVFASMSGESGLMGGQMLDFLLQTVDRDVCALRRAQFLKTAVFFVAVCHVALIVQPCTAQEEKSLFEYAQYLGYLYQVRDDLQDYTKDSGEQVNMASHLGLEKAEVLFKRLTEGALNSVLPVSQCLRKRLVWLVAFVERGT